MYQITRIHLSFLLICSLIICLPQSITANSSLTTTEVKTADGQVPVVVPRKKAKNKKLKKRNRKNRITKIKTAYLGIGAIVGSILMIAGLVVFFLGMGGLLIWPWLLGIGLLALGYIIFGFFFIFGYKGGDFAVAALIIGLVWAAFVFFFGLIILIMGLSAGIVAFWAMGIACLSLFFITLVTPLIYTIAN